MQQMLEDYVAFAKGDSGEKTAQVDVGGLLMEICADADAPGKVIEVHLVHQPIVTMLRRNAFKRAIMNLAVNAERFADRIVIRAGIVENRLFISVEDNGPGIPANRREEVFRPFHSLDNARNQNRKSTGLGLAIARDVIRGHGGEITLGDSALGGLKALIEIPLAPSTAEPETSQELEAID
jgi:two-component system osmolarity sensor histidine kinase EnvZ